jgi:hypothetical protein
MKHILRPVRFFQQLLGFRDKRKRIIAPDLSTLHMHFLMLMLSCL